MLKLKATTKNEEIILDYLTQNASESLVEKINNGTKTLTQCWNYIVSEAEKMVKKRSGAQCVTFDSTKVFGLAVHFFEEDSIKAEKQKPTPQTKTVTTKLTPPQPKAEEPIQLSLFDF